MLPVNEIIKPMKNTMSIHEIIWNREEPEEFGIRSSKCMISRCSHYICPHFDNASSVWKISFEKVSRRESLEQAAVCDLEREEVSLRSAIQHEQQALKIDDYVAVAFEDNLYPGKRLSKLPAILVK